MQTYAYGFLALAAASTVLSQAVTAAISPSASAPSGCAASYSGTFEITVVKTSAKKVKRDALTLTLDNGTLKDALGRIGYIASNYQFQFDGPPQAGAIYTAGFSVCGNGSLALGGSSVWYQCLSGDFYNLYDRSWAAQCVPIHINVVGGSTAATPASAGSVITTAAQNPDGQVYETTMTVVSQITDGQIQAASTVVTVSQIGDGQIQAATSAVVSQIPDGQIQAATSGAPVSQIPDGQIQAATSAVISQIPDGQIQAATSAAVVSQIPDGQIQAATSAAVVSQIPDGQIQAATSAAVVSQIPDGQIQAATSAVVSQISDGQIQAGTLTSQVTSATYTGPLQVTTNAANALAGEGAAIAAGLAAAFVLL